MTSEKTWTEAELRSELDRYEQELRTAGKARNTIATYVQHPERFINWLVGRYEPRNTSSHPGSDGEAFGTGRTSVYEPLKACLASRSEFELSMSFAEIEHILGRALPASARQYRPWWANERAGTHVHARAWLDAGWTTRNVDLNSGVVEFVRASSR